MEKLETEEGTVEIGTPEEAFWTEVRDSVQKDIENAEKALKFKRAVFEMAERRLADEATKD